MDKRAEHETESAFTLTGLRFIWVYGVGHGDLCFGLHGVGFEIEWGLVFGGSCYQSRVYVTRSS